MIPVIWLTLTAGEHPDDKWDAGLLHLMFDGDLWSPVNGHEFKHFRSVKEATVHECGDDCYWPGQPGHGGGAVVVFPAGIHRERYDELNAALAPLEWVLLILTADEGSLFETKHIHHPNLRLWVMTPRPGNTYPPGTRFLGEGFAADTPTTINDVSIDVRPHDIFFAGQVNHDRRRDLCEAIDEAGATVIKTKAFAQGLDRRNYLAKLAATKVAPCPSGPVTPDSFRLFEALEAGCVPIADGICPDYDTPGYWDMVAPGHPFPVVNGDWDAETFTNAVDDYPGNANHAGGWWQRHKREMTNWLTDDLAELGAPLPKDNGWRDRITVLMPTSPIPLNPSTAIIEETVASVRSYLPDAEIIIGIDGIRPEQEDRRADYEEFTRRLLWLCNHEWHNVLPMVFDSLHHQSGMATEAMRLVRTPFVFYVEHDMPLKGEIPFEAFAAALEDGTADQIRMTINKVLEPTHAHLRLDDDVAQDVHGVPMVRTVQWSQQPHLCTSIYYREILSRHFSADHPTYIEWKMHAVCANEWHKNGPIAWFRNRLWIYTPDGDMARGYHLDGRRGDTVFE